MADPRTEAAASRAAIHALDEVVGRSMPHFAEGEWWGYIDALRSEILKLGEAADGVTPQPPREDDAFEQRDAAMEACEEAQTLFTLMQQERDDALAALRALLAYTKNRVTFSWRSEPFRAAVALLSDYETDDAAGERSVTTPRPVGNECQWCHCIGYHSEVCEGFDVNDPARHSAGVTTPEATEP